MLDVSTILTCTFGPIWLLFCIYISWAFWIRRDYDYIHYRSPTITLFAHGMVCMIGTLYIIRWSDSYKIPCFISLWVTQFGYAVVYCAILSRSLRLLFLYRISDAKLFSAFNVQEGRNQRKTRIKTKDTHHKNRLSAIGMNTETCQEIQIFGGLENSSALVKDSWFVRNQKFVSDRSFRWSTGIVLFVHFVVLVIIQCLTTRESIYPTIGFKNCFYGWEWIPHQVFSVMYNIMNLILIFALKQAVDAYGIRTELLVICIVDTIIASFFLFYYNARFIDRIDPHNRLVNISFLNFFTFQYEMIIKPILVAQGRGSVLKLFSGSSNTQELTLSQESFDNLLQNPALMEQFKMFAARDFSIENILFYESCLKFRQVAQDDASSLMLAEAWDIFEMFIACESRLTINLSGNIRQSIQDVLYGNACHVNMFDEAVEEIKDLMFRNTFPRFLQSKYHTDFSWDAPTQV